jgi:hypothetical protein
MKKRRSRAGCGVYGRYEFCCESPYYIPVVRGTDIRRPMHGKPRGCDRMLYLVSGFPNGVRRAMPSLWIGQISPAVGAYLSGFSPAERFRSAGGFVLTYSAALRLPSRSVAKVPIWSAERQTCSRGNRNPSHELSSSSGAVALMRTTASFCCSQSTLILWVASCSARWRRCSCCSHSVHGIRSAQKCTSVI